MTLHMFGHVIEGVLKDCATTGSMVLLFVFGRLLRSETEYSPRKRGFIVLAIALFVGLVSYESLGT